MRDGKANLESLRSRIERTELPEEEAAAVHQFDDELTLRTHDYSDHRRVKLLQHVFIIARETERLADSLIDREAAEDIVRWINETYSNPDTNRDYRVALRMFGKYVGGEDEELPTSMSWISGSTSTSHNPSPNPAEMLKWEEDIQPMVETCRNDRDRAMITVAWDLGARSFEFQNIKVGDLSDGKFGTKVHVDGKRGQRSPTLIPSIPYLKLWLNKHPRGDDDTAPLWCKVQTGEEMTYLAFRKVFRTAAKRTEVTKPVTLTNFRKSSASYLASQGVSQAHLEDHHGWKRGSQEAARYIAIFGDAAEREIAKAHGMEIEEEDKGPTHGPIPCPRCERETPRSEEFCVWCHQALSQESINDIREKTRETRATLLSMVADNPTLLSELNSMEDIVRLIDEDPASLDEAQAFLDALGG